VTPGGNIKVPIIKGLSQATSQSGSRVGLNEKLGYEIQESDMKDMVKDKI